MIAADLISQLASPLRTSDSGEEALTVMHAYHVKHLPIVNESQLLGTVSEEEVIENPLGDPLGSYPLTLSQARVLASDHLFEVMSKMAEYKLTAVPVIDSDGKYLGVITQERLIQFYAESFAFAEPGSIVVLEMLKRDYSLAEISRIIENENISILSTFLTSEPQSEKVIVTLKLNSQESQHALATLERHGFDVKASYAEENYVDDLKGRYDALMHYLKV